MMDGIVPIPSDALGQPLPFRENRFRRAFLLVFVLGITVAFLGLIRSFLMTILLAAIFAGLGYPLFRRLVRTFRGRRPLAALATLLVGFFVVAAPLALVAYMVTRRSHPADRRTCVRGSAGLGAAVGARAIARPAAVRQHSAALSRTTAREARRVGAAASVASSWQSLSNTTIGTLQAVFNVFILAYTVFFLLLDGPQILQTVRRFLPLREGERDLLLDKFVSVTRATLKGTLVIGAVQGTLAGVAFWVAGIDHAVFWGAIMVVLSVIPMLGGAIVWVPACIVLALTGHWVKAVALAAFCGLVVGFDRQRAASAPRRPRHRDARPDDPVLDARRDLRLRPDRLHHRADHRRAVPDVVGAVRPGLCRQSSLRCRTRRRCRADSRRRCGGGASPAGRRRAGDRAAVTTIDLRSATHDDWPAIAALLEQQHLPLDGAADHLPGFVVATREGVVVGVGGLELHGEAALLRSLAVATHGQGLGSRLVSALLEQARERRAAVVVLLTTTAAAFFPRFGFMPVTREDVPHAAARIRGVSGRLPRQRDGDAP